MSAGVFILSAVGLLLIVFLGEGIALFVGLIAFKVATLGLVRVQSVEESKLSFPWHGVSRDSKGRVIAQEQIATFIGVVLLIVGMLLFFAWKAGAI